MTPRPVSDDYKPCVAIYPTGQVRRANVKYIRMMTAEQAHAALRGQKTAYVPPDVYEAEFEKS